MTNEAREKAIRWLTEEVRSLRLAPTVNGCEADNWAEQLEVMETCLESVRSCNAAHMNVEAWEPCDECISCENCQNNEDFDPYEGSYGECGQCCDLKKFKPRNFCHSCGRPLTEEARAELEKRLRG